MSNYRLKAAAISTILIVGGLILYEPPTPVKVERPQNTPVQKENSVHRYGYIDYDQVISKHSKGEELKNLIGKEIRLRLELNEILRPVFPPKLPEIDIKPFEESVRERNMQNVISKFAEIRARKKVLAEEYRQQTEDEYIKRRNANRDIYMNEAFNLTLKLKNAQHLHLTPEQIQEYEKRLDEITFERNEKQKELLDEWTQEINDYVEAQTAEDEAKVRAESAEMEKMYSEEAMQKIRDTQARNKALMEAAIQEVAFRNTRRREILEELSQATRERTKIEDEIFDSIVNESGKLGALYKLDMVFIKRDSSYAMEKLSAKLQKNPLEFNLIPKKYPGAMIFEGKDTLDLTKDLLKAIH